MQLFRVQRRVMLSLMIAPGDPYDELSINSVK